MARVSRRRPAALRRDRSRVGNGGGDRTGVPAQSIGAVAPIRGARALRVRGDARHGVTRQRVTRRRRTREPQRTLPLLRRTAPVHRARDLDPRGPAKAAPRYVGDARGRLPPGRRASRSRDSGTTPVPVACADALARSAGRERVAPRHGRRLLPRVRSPMVAFGSSRNRLVVVAGGRRHDADVHEHFVGDDRLRSLRGKGIPAAAATWVDDSIPPGSSVAVVWDERRAQGRTIEPFYQWIMVTEVFNTTSATSIDSGPATYYEKCFLPTKPVSLRADAVVVEGQAARCRVRWLRVGRQCAGR